MNKRFSLPVVAVFRGGSLAAVEFGRVKFGPHYTVDNVAGTYAGTVHFVVSYAWD